ncbi:hypothetical protein BKA82DRAFT_4345834 [Pisolithus tinctorius]|nr:hypothetical protein BKA82DRAFT_4345834 [Pisolithus tinctorius]
MPNQNKPNPPLSDIEPHIMHMWKARLNDRQIVEELRKLIDTNQYGIGLTKFVQICKEMGLIHTHHQGHTVESIWEVMIKLREIFPNAGVHEMISLLHHKRNMSVSRFAHT